MPLNLLGFSGSSRRPSRTHALVSTLIEATAEKVEVDRAVVDLVDAGLSDNAFCGGDRLRAVVKRIETADALVVGSPVYKGAYAGLFKHVLDQVDPGALRGKPVVLCATGGGDRHALVVEHQMRPLFGFFEAAAMPTAIYAGGDGPPNAILAHPQVAARIAAASEQLAQALASLGAAAKEVPVRAACAAE